MFLDDSSPIASIGHGSVFLLAKWSGPSVLALKRLQKAWTAAGLPESELHVLDWDQHEQRLRATQPEISGRVHGWGEAFNVRRGTITGFQVLGRVAARLDQEVEAFVRRAAESE